MIEFKRKIILKINYKNQNLISKLKYILIINVLNIINASCQTIMVYKITEFENEKYKISILFY